MTTLLSDVISIVLLIVLLVWSAYNGSIIYIGIKHKRQQEKLQRTHPPDAITSTDLSYSIIVPTKNEESVIRRCLDGILNIDYPKNKMQVIIVDGNSTDKTLEICGEFQQKYPETFQVISEQETHGKPAALNLAIGYATNEIVAVFDADSVPHQDVLLKATGYFADPKIDALQGRTTSINERANVLTRLISQEEKAWYQMLLTGREKMQLFVPLNGTCQFVRRPLLMEFGGWDETSLTEDVELAVRLVEKKPEHKIR